MDQQPGRPQDPTTLPILPGMESLPRQIGMFPAFRSAMLEDAARETPLDDWHGREVGDFGVMLFEMWAYVCDVMAFYDQFNANESYLRTAAQTSAARKLIALLGYIPRPAVSAVADLALTLSGRTPIKIPVGTAFRSGAFEGDDGGEEKPQVFTALAEANVHPFVDKMTLTAQPSRTLGTGTGNKTFNYLYFKTAGMTLKKGDVFILRSGSTTAIGTVSAVEDHTDPAGIDLKKVTFSASVTLPASTLLSSITVERATQAAQLFDLTDVSGNPGAYGYTSNTFYIRLSAINDSFRGGDTVVLDKSGTLERYTVAGTSLTSVNVLASKKIEITNGDGSKSSYYTPAATKQITQIKTTKTKVSSSYGGYGGYSYGLEEDANVFIYLEFDGIPQERLHYGFVSGGVITGETKPTLSASDILQVMEALEAVPDAYEPSVFLLRDRDERGVRVGGALSPAGTLTLDGDSAWTGELKSPVTLWGAVARVTRGEAVKNEMLGVGNGSIPNQSFKLKKKPLTYISAASAASGVASTLEIIVDGVIWKEAPVFYGADAQSLIYTIRQDEKGDSWVTFGDGVRGARLASGAVVTANYYFGGGASAPPSNGITQMVKPVKGVTAVTNPVAAFGGADAEAEDSLKKYAPRSVLMLGRAVSLLDYEAAASGVSGIRIAKAEWAWSGVQQRPVVKIWTIPNSDDESASVGALVKDRLVAISAEGIPFEFSAATKKSRSLTVSVLVDSDYATDRVLADVQATVTAALQPEVIGIGGAIIRSEVLAVAAEVEGVAVPLDVVLNGTPMGVGIQAGSGAYFDVTVSVDTSLEAPKVAIAMKPKRWHVFKGGIFGEK